MILPHSNRKTFHVRINIYVVFALVLAAVAVTVAFFVLAAEYTTRDGIISQQEAAEQRAEAELEGVVRQIDDLRSAAQRFNDTVRGTQDTLGIDPEQSSSSVPAGGDLGSLFGLQEVQDGDFRQLYDLQYLRTALEGSIAPLTNIYNTLSEQRDLLEDIPHLWPVAKGRGVVAHAYGPGLHPVFDTWHVQRGVHIASSGFGEEIVSAANGIVAGIDFDPEKRGWHITIEHRYGLSTRYAHLNSIFVGEGERISQGQVIGEIGDTGYVSGPQLGFEIMLGSDALDPADFLQTAGNTGEWTGRPRSGT